MGNTTEGIVVDLGRVRIRESRQRGNRKADIGSGNSAKGATIRETSRGFDLCVFETSIERSCIISKPLLSS
jgi:hypothetical protein